MAGDWVKVYTRIPTELNNRLTAYQERQPEKPSTADVAARAIGLGLGVMEEQESATAADKSPERGRWATSTHDFKIYLHRGPSTVVPGLRGTLEPDRIVDASGRTLTGEIRAVAWAFDHAASNINWRTPTTDGTQELAEMVKQTVVVALHCEPFPVVLPVAGICPKQSPVCITIHDGPSVDLQSRLSGRMELPADHSDDDPVDPGVSGVLSLLVWVPAESA